MRKPLSETTADGGKRRIYAFTNGLGVYAETVAGSEFWDARQIRAAGAPPSVTSFWVPFHGAHSVAFGVSEIGLEDFLRGIERQPSVQPIEAPVSARPQRKFKFMSAFVAANYSKWGQERDIIDVAEDLYAGICERCGAEA